MGLEALVSCLKTQDRRETTRHQQGSQVGQGHSRLLWEPRGHYTEGRSFKEFLIYFFHAGGVLVSLERGDLLRNSCAGFLCCHLVLINA